VKYLLIIVLCLLPREFAPGPDIVRKRPIGLAAARLDTCCGRRMPREEVVSVGLCLSNVSNKYKHNVIVIVFS